MKRKSAVKDPLGVVPQDRFLYPTILVSLVAAIYLSFARQPLDTTNTGAIVLSVLFLGEYGPRTWLSWPSTFPYVFADPPGSFGARTLARPPPGRGALRRCSAPPDYAAGVGDYFLTSRLTRRHHQRAMAATATAKTPPHTRPTVSLGRADCNESACSHPRRPARARGQANAKPLSWITSPSLRGRKRP